MLIASFNKLNQLKIFNDSRSYADSTREWLLAQPPPGPPMAPAACWTLFPRISTTLTCRLTPSSQVYYALPVFTRQSTRRKLLALPIPLNLSTGSLSEGGSFGRETYALPYINMNSPSPVRPEGERSERLEGYGRT